MSFLLFSGQTGILLAKSSLSLRFLGDRLSLELLLLLWATPSLCHFFSELLFCPHSTETPTHQHLLAAQQFPCVLQAPAAIPHRAAPWAAPTIPLHPHSFPMFPIISQCSKTVCRNHFSLIHLFPASSKSGTRLWWLDANCACFIQTERLLQSRGLFPHLSQTKPYNRRNTDPPLVTTQATKPAKHGVWHTSFLSPANSHAHAHCCQLRTPADTSLSNASTTSCVNFPE